MVEPIKQPDLTQTDLSLPALHPIQRQILQRLTLDGPRRYRDLQLDDVDGNLLTYHLKQLIAIHLLRKDGINYELDTKGKWYVGLTTLDTGEYRLQPKLTVMFYITNPAGQLLLFRWQRQPFFDTVSLPYGKVQYGKPLGEQLKDELWKKTNLTCRLTHAGDAFVRVSENGQLFSHMLTQVFTGEADFDTPTHSHVPNGEPFWGRIDALKDAELAPGLTEIATAAARDEPFLLDLAFDLDTGSDKL